MLSRILRTTVAATFAFSLVACGDDNGLGPTIELTEAQADDMMDALLSISVGDPTTGFRQMSVRAQDNSTEVPIGLATTVQVDETYPCPNGGTYRTRGSGSINDAQTQFTFNVTQTYASCASTSSSGTVWTFTTAPSISSVLSLTETSTTSSLTLTQKGAFNASSSVGSGSCVIDLSLSISSNQTAETFTASVTGTLCGRTINRTLDSF